MALSGAITKDSLVWKPGMSAWTKGGDIAELKVVFESAPPPLP
jgi:GYF domain 2